jgi:hypothetical protein
MAVRVIVRSNFAPALPKFLTWSFGDLSAYAEALRLMADLLRPASVLAFVLAAWRLSADLGWAGSFLFEGGLFYQWQIWVALGFAMLATRDYALRRL